MLSHYLVLPDSFILNKDVLFTGHDSPKRPQRILILDVYGRHPTELAGVWGGKEADI